ncbi:hypothetical protein BDV95DRAFT_634422 [Massariosphaeria phaeospora]|uniref:Uncharacterized protein n=1 Tax=Massariosphaeria phaeospora TaxID=100035 RepID=A0A7C8MW36_9PLEO|nr:hypothetical protein BDV95DRAFT_634422 [Massariosphaeria phaeospora]
MRFEVKRLSWLNRASCSKQPLDRAGGLAVDELQPAAEGCQRARRRGTCPTAAASQSAWHWRRPGSGSGACCEGITSAASVVLTMATPARQRELVGSPRDHAQLLLLATAQKGQVSGPPAGVRRASYVAARSGERAHGPMAQHATTMPRAAHKADEAVVRMTKDADEDDGERTLEGGRKAAKTRDAADGRGAARLDSRPGPALLPIPLPLLVDSYRPNILLAFHSFLPATAAAARRPRPQHHHLPSAAPAPAPLPQPPASPRRPHSPRISAPISHAGHCIDVRRTNTLLAIFGHLLDDLDSPDVPSSIAITAHLNANASTRASSDPWSRRLMLLSIKRPASETRQF